MTREELEQEAKEYLKKHTIYDETFDMNFINITTMQAYLDSAEPREKRIAELEKEIEKHKWNDIFLEDCAGYDKKIAEEYKTLQERITEFVSKIDKLEYEKENLENKIEHQQEVINTLQKENAELKSRDCWKACEFTDGKAELIHEILQQQYNLNKTKEIIKDQKELLDRVLSGAETLSEFAQDTLRKAEQFLNSEVEK